MNPFQHIPAGTMVRASTPQDLLGAFFGIQHDAHMVKYRWHLHCCRMILGYTEKHEARS